MKKLRAFFLLLFLIPLVSFSQNEKTPVDIVMCLDLSGTTNGLLESVRENIWRLINKLNQVEPQAEYRIGLVVHGRPSFGKENGYAKILINLTQDLDLLGSQLFSRSFYLEKGNPNPKKAIELSLNDISWSDDARALKFLFIVGNRDLKLDENEVITTAKMKNIQVNCVYYKKYSKAKELQEWLSFSESVGGELFLSDGSWHKPSNYPVLENKELEKLNTQLNKTYISYAPGAESRFKMQEQLDIIADEENTNLFQTRIISKCSRLYQGKNSFWDIVDLSMIPDFDFNKIVPENLPDEYKNIPADKLKPVISAIRKDREKIISTINEFAAKREKYMNEEIEKLKINETNSVGVVLINAIIKSLSAKGFGISNTIK